MIEGWLCCVFIVPKFDIYFAVPLLETYCTDANVVRR